MVTTRSKAAQARPQARVIDFTSQDSNIKLNRQPQRTLKKTKPQSDSSGSNSKKRKESLDPSSRVQGRKRVKTSQSTRKKAIPTTNDEGGGRTIMINRGPVLQLWSACVAHFVYPSLPWTTCISIGSAISTICAVAKARSIGTIAEKDTSEETQKKRRLAKKVQKDLDEIEVMHFKLKLKEGLALVGSEKKGKPGDEGALRRKFGDVEYEETRQIIEETLQGWKGDEKDLNGEAFQFYERFRPDVSKGQKGWGRKGELSLERLKSVVGR